MSVPFGIAVPNYGPLAATETLVRLARLAEDLAVDKGALRASTDAWTVRSNFVRVFVLSVV